MNTIKLNIKNTQHTSHIVKELYKHKMGVNSWVCNNKYRAEALYKMGADHITTNIFDQNFKTKVIIRAIKMDCNNTVH